MKTMLLLEFTPQLGCAAAKLRVGSQNAYLADFFRVWFARSLWDKALRAEVDWLLLAVLGGIEALLAATTFCIYNCPMEFI